MVSNLPVMGMKFKDRSIKNNLPKVILIGLGLISAVLIQWLAVPVVFIFYILLSVFYKKSIE